MKSYPSYKDSGVEWIGKIPSHWEVKKVKYLLDSNHGIKIGPFGSSLKLDTLTESGIKIYGQGNVINNNFQLGHRYMPLERFEKDFSQYEILEGDVLVTMMGTTGKSKVFSSSYERGILDSHLLRLRFNKSIFSSYLFSMLLEQSDYIFQQIKLSSKGSIMEGLNSSIIKELKVLTQPKDEQEQIVSFLDHKTQQIDDLIEKTEKKIELLKEKRTSLINHCVTKGLNPDVEMEDSGVEWIGEIPSGWNISKLKYLGTITSGDGIVKTELDENKEYPVYGGNGIMGYCDNFNRREKVIVVGRVGEKCGNVHLVNEECWITDNSLIISLYSNRIYDWAYYSLETRNLNKLRNQNTQPLITSTQLKNEFIPFPSEKEQKQIVEYLDEQTQKIDSTIEKEIQRIELLKEYRQSLISEAVTGKIDVRDWKE